jgi:zinc protease
VNRLAALVVLALGAVSHAATEPQLKFEKYQLKNGLTVILSEDHRLPQVAVDIWYHVGAANQTPGKSGFAHLFEHMMFSGAKHIGPQPFQILESVGTSAGGMANGTTSFDRTNYFEVVPSNELPTALWLESDRMGFLLDTLDEKKLAIQRDVVSNERRQSYENRPYGLAFLRTCDLLYPSPHPYFNCVIGTLSDIQSASMQDLRSFFQKYYAPNNASLVLVGDFDPKEAKALIEKYFGAIPAGPKVDKPQVPQPQLKSEVREKVVDKVAEVPMLSMAWNGVKPFSPEEAVGDVLADILGEGKTSRLYRSLVFEKQLASQVSASNSALDLGGFFSVEVVAQTGHTIDELSPLTQAILDEVKKNGVTAQEVDRAKRKILAGKLRGLERIGGFGGKADLLNFYETALGDPGFLSKDLERYRAVTPEAVKAFAQKYLPDDRRLVLDVEPASAGGARAERTPQGGSR